MTTITLGGGISYSKFTGDEMDEAARRLNYGGVPSDTDCRTLAQAVRDREILLKRVGQAVRELRDGDGYYGLRLLEDAIDLAEPRPSPLAESLAASVQLEQAIHRLPEDERQDARAAARKAHVAGWSVKAVAAGPRRFRGVVMAPNAIKFPAGTHPTMEAAHEAARRLCDELRHDERAAADATEAAIGLAVA